MRNSILLINLASFVIIMTGLYFAKDIVIPFLLAVFLAVLISPIITYMQKLKIPRAISLIIVLLCFFGLFFIIGNVVAKNMTNFLTNLPDLQSKFMSFYSDLILKFSSFTDYISFNESLFSYINPNNIFLATSGALKWSSTLISKTFIVLLLFVFMIIETNIFKQKVIYFSNLNSQNKIMVDRFISDLKRYLAIKTISSLATGVLVWIVLIYLNVPYAPIWGMVAFLLNYIPTIGSIIASIPAILIALLLNGYINALWVSIFYLVINISIGNFIEPKFLGDKLGLSTLVVILSLIFWGFVLGIGGMFLAVPLTMSLKIAMDSNKKTKFISILLSNKD
ncbi:transporter [Campylobacter sputorum subsp. bubulus]|uniref:Transporter n=1 Tax=Campylobacter sputorum subsp. sputorum TaxID=32024 RepID=A0A381DKA0_9BACT|nr:AI-2E family transporter [Campylobacter sputorum]ASM34461.1 putative autoinducer 2 transporter [Campylobacter sputorum aubsp. sputorum RM3237]ASM36126.1 putative autoinducer 2 transporter [Campylobacter sputorum bv. faecalis CCUG 20703]ASM37809.1 putative autoinducer 2 transporter [Campylobacter sputorum bv. paraureolyticus LMG 11764]KAB0582150.1 AI-2E family transporter [Campylobacter sputorum subsp. sputorum]MDY6119892.1 AI-2E family transporter [Campylobacter sputorum]